MKTEESAMLIGMLQNSSLYDPIKRPEITKKRRDLVLMQMAKNNYLSEKQKDSLQKIPLELNYTPQSHRRGLATYFRSYLRGFMKNWTNNNYKKDGSSYNLYVDGLKIYTTINSKMQQYAEESVIEHMKNLQKEHSSNTKRASTKAIIQNSCPKHPQTIPKSFPNHEQIRPRSDLNVH